MKWVLLLIVFAQSGLGPKRHVTTDQVVFTGQTAEEMCLKAKKKINTGSTWAYCLQVN